MRRFAAPFAIALILLSETAFAEDGFYEARLAGGKRAYSEKRTADAATELRIAAFGFLDRPQLLSEALLFLALSESVNGRTDVARRALMRLIDVETRFRTYGELAIDAPTRKKFEQLLVATLAPDTIASVPAFAALVSPQETRVQTARESRGARDTPPKPATPAVASPPPSNVRTTPLTPANPATTPRREDRPASTNGDPASTNGDPAIGRSEPTAIHSGSPGADPTAKAANLLEENRNDEALALLSDVVAKSPTRTARVLLLHAATRAHRWQTGVAQIPFIQPFAAGEEVTMFYAAVSLYQTGKPREARTLLERALPGINSSTYVEIYKKKILGR